MVGHCDIIFFGKTINHPLN